MECNTHIVILAAGQGTRMKSGLPKVMHDIAGMPMIGHILHTANRCNDVAICTVISKDSNITQDFISSIGFDVQMIVQDKQLGTADALKSVLNSKINFTINDKVIVLFGDTPLVTKRLIDEVSSSLDKNALSIVGMIPDDPKEYGRLICDESGQLRRIVEFKHATDAERDINLCNSGIMGFKYDCLQKLIGSVRANELNGEYYLTDTVEIAYSEQMPIGVVQGCAKEVEGVNTQLDLSRATSYYQDMKRQEMMEHGCRLPDPASVFFSYDTTVGSGCVIEPNVWFGKGVSLGGNVHIRAFSYIEGTKINDNVVVGPFARLRGDTTIQNKAKVGNFVEIKNSCIGEGTKVNHLSYIGDSYLGNKVNIGAGTITCNYDGFAKHKTVVGEGSFIGSNSCLIAPVELKKEVIVGAGSVITKDVADHSLAIARVSQKNIDNGAKKIRNTKNKLK